MADGGDAIVSALREEVGDGLRAVAWFDVEDYEILYFRDDIDAKHDEEAIEDVYQEQLFEVLNEDYRIDLFDVGDVEGTVYLYEQAYVLRYLSDDGGLFISVDRTDDVDLDGLIGCCDGLRDEFPL
jgi:hypothetical protein